MTAGVPRPNIARPPPADAGGLELVVGEDLEREVKSAVELVLPLLGQAARADDQAALQVAARDQLFDEKARHDRLAGARVVGEQEAAAAGAATSTRRRP
jgi:hypothetical protein